MKKLNFNHNGIYIQFYVNDDNQLYLYNFSTRETQVPYNLIEIPEQDEYKIGNELWAVEVQLATASNTRGKHMGHLCPTVPKYVSHSDTVNEKGRLITMVLSTETLEIKQNYQFYGDIKTVNCYAEVKNISDSAAPLEYVSSFCYGGFINDNLEDAAKNFDIYLPHNSWSDELNFRKHTLAEAGFNTRKNTGSSNRLHLSNRGCWPTKEFFPMGIVNDRINCEFYFWQIESNNMWTWEMGDYNDRLYLRLAGPGEQEHSWYKKLSSNEIFTSVPVAVSVTNSFDEAVAEMTKYRRKIINEGRIDKELPVIVNDYMWCLLADPTTEKVIPIVESAAKLGAEIYCMDAGWYSNVDWWPLVGEWEICEERFPGGLKAIYDRIRELGMRGGIWLEPEVMGINCPLVPEFEDCFFKYRGNNVISKGRYQLDFRKEKVINHLNKVVDNLIEKLGVTYFKFDYNIEPLYGTETDADSVGDGLYQSGIAYLKWIDSLYERHPGLIIENCASGGMRMDYASLKHFALQSVSDAAYYNEFAHMGVMAPLAVIPEQTGIWVVPTNENNLNQNASASINSMLNRMYISGRIDLLREEDFASLKKSVEVYKSFRDDLINCSPIFPCGTCNYDSEWMIGGRITEDKGAIYLSVTNMRSKTSEKEICINEYEGKEFSAEILYPSFVGKAEVKGGKLIVDLPEKSAILIKLTSLS